MGTYFYSSVKTSPTVSQCEADLRGINTALWGEKYRVEQIKGLPVTSEDDRAAKWCFTEPGAADASFSIVLLRDGRLEFKVPRSQWDECWKNQQKVRRRLVRRYNKGMD